MTTKSKASTPRRSATPKTDFRQGLPGQIVLVLQGGGALGAYQVGVYQAMHEAGIEPQWVIGTSIGAINGAIIAGNPPTARLEKLTSFWDMVEQQQGTLSFASLWPAADAMLAKMDIVSQGVPGFFAPNPNAVWGPHHPAGVENAAMYLTAPLKKTLSDLIDFDYINTGAVRLTIGAVRVATGEMRYFDNRETTVSVDHIMASGALPPGFPAVRIDGAAYWDGGLYSNTPIEAVLEDNPRRDSLIFTVDVWHPQGPEPETIWQVIERQKDITYASRANSHIARQGQIHRLRHIIHELAQRLPAADRKSAAARELAAWGCTTRMHVVRLTAPRLAGEDHTKDIDFTATGISARREAGYADTQRMLAAAPWTRATDALTGVVVHDLPEGN